MDGEDEIQPSTGVVHFQVYNYECEKILFFLLDRNFFFNLLCFITFCYIFFYFELVTKNGIQIFYQVFPVWGGGVLNFKLQGYPQRMTIDKYDFSKVKLRFIFNGYLYDLEKKETDYQLLKIMNMKK